MKDSQDGQNGGMMETQILAELRRMRDELDELQRLHQENRAQTRILQEHVDRYQKIFQYSNDAIFIIDPQRDELLDVNPRACTLLGFEREELLKKRVSDIHPHEMPKLLEFARSVLDQGVGWTNELSCLTKDGRRLPAEMSASVLEVNERKCVLAMVRDISSRKAAEQALRESERRFRTLVESAVDAFMVTTLDGSVVEVNDAACEMLGYTRSELLKLHTLDYAPDFDPRAAAEAWKAALNIPHLETDFAVTDREAVTRIFQSVAERWKEEGERVAITLELDFVRKDGTRFPVEARVGFIEIQGELRTFSMARDITARKRVEAELRAARRELERLETFQEIDRAILTARSSEEIARAALARIRGRLPCEHASVAVFDFERHEATVLATMTQGQTAIASGTRLPLRDFGLDKKLRKGKTRVVDDISAGGQPPLIARLEREGVRSFVNVPLVAQGKLIGTLNLGASQVAFFDEEQVEIAAEIADRLAIAIQQAHLHEQVQRHA